MTACRHFMAICFGLAAWFWCTAGAFAQERPASAQPEGAGSRAGVVAPSDFPWDTVEWVERRYKIEAMHFKARDETGIDWWGDDDVMIETVDAKGWTVCDEIGDVDSGETHPRPPFDPAKSCIIAVRPGIVVLGKTSVCDDVGEPAPLWFEVEFWEKDFEILPDYPAGFCNTVGQSRAVMAGRTSRTTPATTTTISLAAPGSTSRYGNSRPRCPMSAMNISKPSY